MNRAFLILLLYLTSYSVFAQSFLPNSISGLSFWFSADSVSVPNVNTWYDKSGNNNNAVQTDPAKYPVIILSDSTINYQPYIYFDGIDKFLEVPDANSLDFSDKFTIFILAKQKPNSGLNTFLSKWDYPTQGSWAIEASPGTSSITTYIASALDDGGGNNITFNNINFSDNQYRIFTFIFNGVDSQNKLQLKVNSTTIPAQISGAITSVLMNSAASLKIGAFGGLSRFFNGNMAEILGYNNILNDSQLDSVYQYLQNKYAPPVNLGSDINIDYGFCPDTLHAGTRFKHFQWYKNGLLLINDTLESISINQSGFYKVYATDIFDFISSDSIYVTYPNSNLSISDTTICLGDSIEVTNSLSVLSGYSFLWSNNSTTTFINISTPDTISLIISDTNTCSISSDTILISVDSLSKKISLGDNLNLCSGNFISLLYYPENQNELTFLWSDNITTDSLFTVDTSGYYWVSVTNIRGCSGQDTIHVNIIGSAPVFNFTADTVCLGIPTLFSIFPSPPVDSLRWNFGDNFFDTSPFPVHTYSTSDTFYVSLTEFDSVCFKTISKSVIVKPVPSADYIFSNSCVGIPVLFTNTSITQGAGIFTNYLWDFAGLYISNSSDTSFAFPISGNYLVSLTVTSLNGCTDSIIRQIYTVSTAPLSSISLLQPANNSFISNNLINFSWNDSLSVFFILELSFNFNFDSIIYTDSTSLNLLSSTFLFSNNQIVYWRIKAYNYCYQEKISDVSSFTFFNPLEISGMAFWFSADSVIAPNGIVNLWSDKSGNNNNAFQSEAALRPNLIIADSSINNNPVIHFDGNGKFLEVLDTNTLDFSDQFTIFFISSQAITAGYPTYLCKWDYSTQGSWAIMSSPTPSEIITTIAPEGVPGGDDNFTTINSNILPDQYKLFSFQFNGNLENANRLKVNINSNDINTTVNGNIVTELINSSANLKIGTFGGLTNRFFEGNIGEIIGFNYVLSDTLFTSVINYFRGKYFPPPVNLGSDINILYGFCDTIVHAGNRFTQFSWSTGETTESISVSYPGGTFTVSVTDVFGFKSTDSIIIKYPTYNQLSDTTICFGDTLFWNLNFNGQYNYIWNDGITSAIRNITLENTYQVTITDTTLQQCSIVTQPVFVKVDSFPNFVTLGPDADMCIGNTLYLQNGYNEAVTYLWNNNDTSNYYLITTQDTIITVTVTDSMGCIGNDSLIITGISGVAPIANFTYQGICFGDTTFFEDLSSGDNINSWLWNFNNEATSADSSTFNIFNVAGIFPVKLTITTSDGCFNTIIKNINIHNLPAPAFSTTNNCTNNFTNFINSTISVDSVTMWNWSFGDNITSNDSTSIHSYSQEGNYIVSLIATSSFGCINTIEKTISIKPAPLTDFNYSPVCKGQPVYFADNTQTQTWNQINFWKWEFGDATSSLMINPTHTYNTINTFIVKYITKAVNGCSDTSYKTLIVTMPPEAAFIGLDACVNSNHQLNDLSTSDISLTQWKWKIDSLGNFFSQNPVVIFTDTLQYNAELVVVSQTGCTDTILQIINVHSNPVADFVIIPEVAAPLQTITFDNNSTGAVNYLWNFDDELISTNFEPVHTFADSGLYNISLISFNEFGCKDTVYSAIKIVIPQYDIAVLEVNSSTTVNFIKVSAKIANFGSLPVDSVYLFLDMGNGVMIKEILYYHLQTGEIINYNFISQLEITPQNSTSYICVDALPPENITDFAPANNHNCIALVDNFEVLPPYPSPVGNYIYIEFIIPAEGNVIIYLTNSLGQKMKTLFNQHTNAGFNRYVYLAGEISNGTYYYQIEYNSKIKTRKFIKY